MATDAAIHDWWAAETEWYKQLRISLKTKLDDIIQGGSTARRRRVQRTA